MHSVGSMDRVWLSNSPSHIISRPYSLSHMVYYRDRVSSFETWPVQLLQDKHSLASAGLYYTNKGDLVKYFSCDLCLGEWLKEDNVWKEHQRWSPRCNYSTMVGFLSESAKYLGTAVLQNVKF